MSTTIESNRNGVDTKTLFATLDAVKAQPELGTFQFRVRNRWLGGAHNLRVPVIRLNQFLPDTQRIGRGVIVNQGNWQQQLEDNKNAFTEEFVQRPAFLAALPLSMTSADFVDKLNDNAKSNSDAKPLTPAERDSLVAALNNGTMTRAQVLRAVAI